MRMKSGRKITVSARMPEPRQRVIDLREKVAGTQKQMAIDLNMTDWSIRRIEKGYGDPSFMIAFVIAEYLGATVYDLFPDVVNEAKSYLESCVQPSLKG